MVLTVSYCRCAEVPAPVEEPHDASTATRGRIENIRSEVFAESFNAMILAEYKGPEKYGKDMISSGLVDSR